MVEGIYRQVKQRCHAVFHDDFGRPDDLQPAISKVHRKLRRREPLEQAVIVNKIKELSGDYRRQLPRRIGSAGKHIERQLH